MSKIIIFLAGLPACGKDTVANYFKEKGYFPVSFSSDILRPIIENTRVILPEFLNYSLETDISSKDIEDAILKIESEKEKSSGRELYINVGAKILPEIVRDLSKDKYSHFNVFCKKMFEGRDKIIIASFRMIEELKTLKQLYPDAIFVKILVKTKDNIRYERIKSRDGLMFEKFIKDEKYEREVVYDKLVKKVNFDYEINNHGDREELVSNIEKTLREI